MIYQAGHVIIPRPAYYPCDGPIEYIYNLLEVQLKVRCNNIHNGADLIHETNQIIEGIQPVTIRRTFEHCGYGI